MKSNPQHCNLQLKKNCVIGAGPDLFSLLTHKVMELARLGRGGGGGGGGGSVQFCSL